MESEEENDDGISDENTFVQDIDDDDSERQEAPVEKSRKKSRSIVWKFFNLLENGEFVQCQLCGEKNKDGRLAYHRGTSSMREHLKRRHPATLDIHDASHGEAKRKQRKIISYTRNLVCSNSRSIAITELIAYVIIKDLRPVNLVNGQGFQKLIAYLEPGYKLPSATHFTKVIEHKYEEIKQKLKNTMQEVEGLSVTADLWCSMANDAYLSLTAHFITDEWAMQSVCLGTMPVSDRHTGVNIVSWIEDKLAEFSIDPVRVVGFVHDSASNMKLSGQLLHEKYGWASESCAGHDIQLCLKDGLQIDVVDRAIGAARRLVEHFKKVN